MFTGIVEGRGRVADVKEYGTNRRLVIDIGRAAAGVSPGDSVSINGACLSVISRKGSALSFDAIAETLRKTNLGDLARGSRVNYETSMTAGDLIGGHLVTGHVDGTGTISAVEDEEGSKRMVVSVPQAMASMVMEKGLIAVDGISLTPAEVGRRSFTLYLIPDTLAKTTISERKKGDRVNIELDLFGKYIRKYVESMMPAREKK